MDISIYCAMGMSCNGQQGLLKWVVGLLMSTMSEL
jgi:hypothetical protein